MPSSQNSSEMPKVLILVITGIIWGFLSYLWLWRLDSDGLSIVSKTTPYWDFNNLWVGAKIATQNNVDLIFDPNSYRAEMRSLLHPNISNQEWSYPPSMLLLGAPFSFLPILHAYIIWSILGIIALFFSIKLLSFPNLPTLALTLNPATFYCLLLGQNGILISAVLLSGLLLLPRRPIVAGVLLGVLTIKPQFGLLIPFFLIASKNWRAFLAASMTTIFLVIATGLVFGFATWTLFITETQPVMRTIMNGPYLQIFHTNAATVFITMRATGATLIVSHGVQIAVGLACLFYVIKIWLPNSEMDHRLRTAITIVLIFLTTPYAYTYDMVALCVSIGIFYVIKPGLKYASVFGFIWLFPLYNHGLFQIFKFSFGGIFLAVLLIAMIKNLPTSDTGSKSSLK